MKLAGQYLLRLTEMEVTTRQPNALKSCLTNIAQGPATANYSEATAAREELHRMLALRS